MTSSSPSGSGRTPGADLKRYTIDDVHAALEAMRTRADGPPARGATVNTSVAAVKALLGFAHKVGFSRFNAAPLIKLRKGAARARAAAPVRGRRAPPHPGRQVGA
jgi:hypothetical protein